MTAIAIIAGAIIIGGSVIASAVILGLLKAAADADDAAGHR